MAQAAVLRAHNRAYNKGSDPRVATCRGKLQTRRSKLNQEINRELRLRAGAENLLKATSNRKLRETVSLELSFLNSNLQLLKQQLADLNSSVELYQPQSNEPIMPMIPLGLKETKEIDFREPFKDFILEHYSEDGDKYESAITEFMELRQAMRTPDRDASGIALLYQYFNHLYFVERRFFPPDRSLGIYFEWYDSLTGAPSCQRTVALEKACVVFNCGALYTQVGAREAKRDPKALDRAVDAFLRAAGTLQYLIDNFTNAPSLDLSPAVLSLLININLAQARECLVEKLELQKQKDRSCEELSKETGALAQAYSETKMAAEGLEEIPASWTGIVALKTEYYRGVQCEREAECSSSSCRSGWLKSSLGHYEEAARLQRMSRDLRGKRSLQECLQRAMQRISSALAQTPQELDEPLELPQPSSGGSKFELRPTPPDFGEQRVDDLFRSLGPLAVFSAKHHWSAPRTVLLRHKMTSQSNSSAASYGLTVSTDCPVVVTSVTPNSLAQCGGIKEGDYIVGIGDKDVKWWSHDEVVRLIKEAQGTLYLRLVTPMDKPSRHVSRSSKKGLTETANKSRTTPEGTGGKPSSTSSLKKLSWNPFRRNKDQREAAALTMILT